MSEYGSLQLEVITSMGEVWEDAGSFFSTGGGFSLPAAIGEGTVLAWQQIITHIYDPSNKALNAVSAGVASGNHGTRLGAPQVWQHCYDPTSNALRVVVVASGGDSRSRLSVDQMIRECFDPVKNALRVVNDLAAIAYSASSADAAISHAYNETDHALRVRILGVGSGHYGTKLDARQALLLTFDPIKSHIRLVG